MNPERASHPSAPCTYLLCTYLHGHDLAIIARMGASADWRHCETVEPICSSCGLPCSMVAAIGVELAKIRFALERGRR